MDVTEIAGQKSTISIKYNLASYNISLQPKQTVSSVTVKDEI